MHSAQGLTLGRDIYVSPALPPNSPIGRHVLRHEIAHVLQQAPGRSLSTTVDLEREADAAADAEGGFLIRHGAPAGTLQRQAGLPPGFVERRLIPELTADAEAWKRYVDIPPIAEAMRENSWIQHGYRDDPEFQRWMKDPGYRPAGSARADAALPKPAEAKPVPIAPAAPTTDAPRSGYFYENGEPVRGPVIERPSEVLGLRAAPAQLVPAQSPTPAADWATEWNRMTPQERAAAQYAARTTPKQRWQDARRAPPPLYIGPHERALLEYEATLRMIPMVRAGVSAAQAIEGEDLLGRPVDRKQAAAQSALELMMDATLFFGPEDLIIGGGAEAPVAERGLSETATFLEPGASKAGVETATDVPLAELPQAEPIGDVPEHTLPGESGGSPGGTGRRLEGGEREPLQLPRLSSTTEENINTLIRDTNRDFPLTRVNAERVVRGPQGANVTVAGEGGAGADVTFIENTPNGQVVLRREVKCIHGGAQGSFNDEVGWAAAEQLKYRGEIFVQVPAGTDATRMVLRFRGARTAEELGLYRSVDITIVDPEGTELFSGPLAP